MALAKFGHTQPLNPAALPRQERRAPTSTGDEDMRAMAQGIQEWFNGSSVFSDLHIGKPARKRGSKASAKTR